MSAIKHIKPDKVLFHYGTEPTGAWWKQTRPHVTPVQAIVPTEIFGNPVPHVAHRTGVLRLRTLIAYGETILMPTSSCNARSTTSSSVLQCWAEKASMASMGWPTL